MEGYTCRPWVPEAHCKSWTASMMMSTVQKSSINHTPLDFYTVLMLAVQLLQ